MVEHPSIVDTPALPIRVAPVLVEALLTQSQHELRSLLAPTVSLWASTDEQDDVVDLVVGRMRRLNAPRVRVLNGPLRTVVRVTDATVEPVGGLTLVALWNRETIVSLRCYVDESAA